MSDPNSQASYTNYLYFPGQSMPPSIHNPSFSYPPQFQSNPSVSLPPHGYNPGSGPWQYPSNIPGFGAQPVYSDPGAASANWVVKQSAPVTYCVPNLPEMRKVGEPWCNICNVSCTSTDCLQQHLKGKRHQKSLQKLANPNTVSVASLPFIIPNKTAATTPVSITSAEHNLPMKGRAEEPWCEVYFDYMRNFRAEFNEFFEGGTISEIEVGLGSCGELRYPSYPANHGWKYPGIGEFQCYDKYLMKSLQKAAEVRGVVSWGRAPDNSGSYNSWPHKTGFFRDGGDYDSYYGKFFLNWYSKVLIDHGGRVLALANQVFEGFPIAAKLSDIHWWYKTASHAAELTAGLYNFANRDGNAPIVAMLKQHEAALNFTCVELRTMDQHESYPEALADPGALVWQVLNAAWDVCIRVASENALTCYDREGYNKILENAKPRVNPDGNHLSAFLSHISDLLLN